MNRTEITLGSIFIIAAFWNWFSPSVFVNGMVVIFALVNAVYHWYRAYTLWQEK